jgi:hypothetical protein
LIISLFFYNIQNITAFISTFPIMSYNYSILARQSDDNRVALGLSPVFNQMYVPGAKNRFINAQRKLLINQKVQQFYESFDIRDINITLSLDNHVRFLPWVRQNIDDKAELTIGHIRHGKKKAYHFGEKELRGWLVQGVEAQESLDVNFHVWITLSSMEIIDITHALNLYFYEYQELPEKNIPFVAGKPEKMFFKTSWHPFAIGNDIVSQIYKNSLLNIHA